ncbi:hypothetical protein KP509_1Z124000 [Ceratopteris richardii]|nr:hypothetical protein KP509_1Z124000 [Ceratopteris richardii]
MQVIEAPEPHFFHNLVGHGEHSDLDVETVPDMAGKLPTTFIASSASNHASRKKRNPADKEQNRMKRCIYLCKGEIPVLKSGSPSLCVDSNLVVFHGHSFALYLED